MLRPPHRRCFEVPPSLTDTQSQHFHEREIVCAHGSAGLLTDSLAKWQSPSPRRCLVHFNSCELRSRRRTCYGLPSKMAVAFTPLLSHAF
jgi:hypothetical protein